jgi:hypothetical protein
MSTDQEGMKKALRAARVARLIERLQRLDDGTLEVLDRLTAEAVKGSEIGARPEGMNRRRFLGAAAGGALVIGIGGLALWQYGETRVNALRGEVSTLQELVELYEELDAVALDDKVTQGLATVGGLVSGLRQMAEGLATAAAAARTALLDFQANFASLQASMQWLRSSLSTMSQRLLGLENEVSQALGLSGPITETLGAFLAEVMDRLPTTARARLGGGLERMGEAITAIPPLVQGLYTRILEPLGEWFSSRSADGLSNVLVNPLLTTVLDPLEALTTAVLDLESSWQTELAGPLEERIEQRQEIRSRIARLRQEL